MSRITTGYTGHLFEEEVLGLNLAVASRDDYLPYATALEVARKGQPPLKTPTRARIERELRSLLGDAVRVRTAVHTVLDYKHVVDGFIDFEGMVVTIDLTMNPSKDVTKADFVVCEDDLIDIAALAGRIAREFESRRRRMAASITATTRRTQW